MNNQKQNNDLERNDFQENNDSTYTLKLTFIHILDTKEFYFLECLFSPEVEFIDQLQGLTGLPLKSIVPSTPDGFFLIRELSS